MENNTEVVMPLMEIDDQCQCDPTSIRRVVMPLIRVMSEATLSWADREVIAAAITRTCSHRRVIAPRAVKPSPDA